jgi:hypothetical protein
MKQINDAASFNWEETARQTLDLFKKIAYGED